MAGHLLDTARTPRTFALLDTDGFVDELHHRLPAARSHVEVQLMTFDGDRSGLAVAGALIDAARRGVRVRLLVDSFAHRFVSDRPVRRADVRPEYRRTVAMFDELRAGGVELRFTRPNGPLNVFAMARNHKKMYVIDDTAYLGGVNVSDHNFAWHDFMVRIDEASMVTAVVADFDRTFAGGGPPVGGPIITDRALEATFDEMLSTARHRVIVASPYALDRHLVRALTASPAPERLVVVADHNNFRVLQAITPYLAGRLRTAGVALRRYHRFSHCKFVLVDDDRLLIGSSNYGRHSFWCNEEIGLVIRDRAFIAEAETLLLAGLVEVDTEGTLPLQAFGWGASAGMDLLLRLYSHLIVPRVAPLARP
ncbi:MAG: phosphatidylserine/phosphatidylglycerophosphate/cardiolipin synthase family protein [Acidimicrobiales bacterium]